MDWLTSVVGDAVARVLVEIFLALLALASAYVVAYLHRLSVSLQERTKSELADAAIARVEKLTAQAVLAAEGTVARELRSKVVAGEISPDALRQVGKQVAQEVFSTLDTAARKALEEQTSDVEAYIKRVVEAQLEALKAQGMIPRMEQLRVAQETGTPK